MAMKANHERKTSTKRLKPEVWLCDCVGIGHADAHAWTNLTKGYITLVSVEDADLLAAHCWSTVFNSSGMPYARRTAGGKHERLHRVITGAVGDAQVDHVNHGTLDNRRLNLRPAIHSQNGANRPPMKRRSPHIPEGISMPKGVHFLPSRKNRKKPFRVQVASRHVGNFATAEEAARAYDARARELWGEFAFQNYPDEPVPAAAE
jgi:hypothetical protein